MISVMIMKKIVKEKQEFAQRQQFETQRGFKKGVFIEV